MKKISILLFAICILSSNCVHSQKQINPEAKKISSQAISLIQNSGYPPNDEVLRNAITLLDQATKLDSNFYYAYYNKFIFQNELKDYRGALIASLQMLKLRPKMVESITTVGSAYEKIGDTISSTRYFRSALSSYNSILDTMSVKNKDYKTLQSEKAIDLIMLKREKDGYAILKELYTKEPDPNFKQMYQDFMNWTRHDFLYGPPNKTISVNAIKK